MGFEKFAFDLISGASPIFIGICAVILALFLGLKYAGVGVAFGNQKKLVDDGQLAKVAKGVETIGGKLETVEQRLATVEHDLDQRATRTEVHEIQLALARYEGRMSVIEQVGKATNASVERIEGYMFEYGVRANAARMRRDD